MNLSQKFTDWFSKNTQQFEADRQAKVGAIQNVANSFKNYVTQPPQTISTSTKPAIDLNIDTTPLKQKFQEYVSPVVNTFSPALQSVGNKFTQWAKEYDVEQNAARRSGVWQSPSLPLLQQYKKQIESVPVVGGLLSSLTTLPENQVASIAKLRKGETLSEEEAQELNEQTMFDVLGMATPVKGLRKGAPGGFTNVRELDNPLIFGKNWQERVGVVEKETLQDYGKAKASVASQVGAEDFDNMVKQAGTNVKDRVNFLDYFRTPDRTLAKIGLGNEAKQLRTSYDKYLTELPQEINRIRGWLDRVPDKDSNQRIFQWLDGKQVQLFPEEQKVAGEIKDYLAQWADRLGLPQDKRISSYITHIFPKGPQGEFDPEIASLIRGKVAGSVYDPFLQKRSGQEGYIEDWVQAIQAYTKRALRKSNLDPVLEKIKTVSEGLETSQYNYVRTKIDQINLRPNDLDQLIDNTIKQSPIGYTFGARPTIAITQKARQMVYRGLLGLNPASAIKNLSQGVNTYSELGERYTLRGYYEVAKNLPKILSGAETELNRVGVLADDILLDSRQLNAWKSFSEKADKTLFYLFETAERINRGAAYWGAKAKGLKQGMSETEAIEYAKNIVRKTQFSFGSIDVPSILGSDIAKTLFQFQTFTLKQFEYLGEKISQKDIAGLVRYVGATYLLTATFGKFMGWEPKDLFPGLRFGVPPTLQLPVGIGQAITQETDKYGNDLTLTERILNPNVVKGVTSYIPAGGQITKTYQGLKAVNEGGSYTPSGLLRYPVEPGVQPLVLGPSRTPGAQDYYEGGSPLSKNQTEQYKTLIASGVSPTDAYNSITTQRKATDQFNVIVKEAKGEQTFGDKVKSFVAGLFAPKVTETQTTDPIIAAYQNEIAGDEKAAQIREIFKLGLSKEKTEAALEKAGLGSYEEASITIMRALGVENGNRGRLIGALLSGKTGAEKKETLLKLADQGVFTSGVVDQWLDNGEITQEQAKVLKNLIKSSKGTYKGSISVPHVPMPSFKAPSFSPLKLKAPSVNIQPLATPEFKIEQRTMRLEAPKMTPQSFEAKFRLREPVTQLSGLGSIR